MLQLAHTADSFEKNSELRAQNMKEFYGESMQNPKVTTRPERIRSDSGNYYKFHPQAAHLAFQVDFS